jgi:hypothetical protein
MRTLLDTQTAAKPAKKAPAPKLSRSGIPMKDLNRFAKELAHGSRQNAIIFEKMVKAGYVPT